MLEVGKFEDVALNTSNEVDVDTKAVKLELNERVEDDCIKSISDAELLDERDKKVTFADVGSTTTLDLELEPEFGSPTTVAVTVIVSTLLEFSAGIGSLDGLPGETPDKFTVA